MYIYLPRPSLSSIIFILSWKWIDSSFLYMMFVGFVYISAILSFCFGNGKIVDFMKPMFYRMYTTKLFRLCVKYKKSASDILVTWYLICALVGFFFSILGYYYLSFWIWAGFVLSTFPEKDFFDKT